MAIYSETARKAMANILPFSLGVLVILYGSSHNRRDIQRVYDKGMDGVRILHTCPWIYGMARKGTGAGCEGHRGVYSPGSFYHQRGHI